MPEATAQLNPPVQEQKPVIVEDDLKGLRQGIGISSDLATGNKGPAHNPVPVKESFPIPEYVPSGETVTHTNDIKGMDVPETFKPDTHMDNLRHILPVDFNDEGAAPRAGNSGELNEAVKKRNDHVLNAINNPPESGNLFKAAKGWFYKEEK